eukprot:650771-Rhodomonas_salina.1
MALREALLGTACERDVWSATAGGAGGGARRRSEQRGAEVERGGAGSEAQRQRRCDLFGVFLLVVLPHEKVSRPEPPSPGPQSHTLRQRRGTCDRGATGALKGGEEEGDGAREKGGERPSEHEVEALLDLEVNVLSTRQPNPTSAQVDAKAMSRR